MLLFVPATYLEGTKKKNEFREVHYEFTKVRDIEVKLLSKEVNVNVNDTDYITKSYSCLCFDNLAVGNFIQLNDTLYEIKSKKSLRLNKYVLEVYNQ